jgi:hypothetical protein
MPGPLAIIDTLTAGINLDINRLLYMGPEKTIKFMVPDTTQLDNWRVELTLTKGFNRITGLEKTQGDGTEVIFKVADPDNVLSTIVRLKDLYVEVEDIIYSVGSVPPVASNEAQVYTLTCKTRTLRNKYFDTTK